ncbi:MAG: aspartate kinase [Muribaculaceae bacterium]|nr:aspartate kinase [Muribaculaceae bacterium]
MKVQKFGGTSVGTPQRIRDVASLVSSFEGRNFIVLSAMSGTTNSLLEIADALKNNNKKLAAELTNSLEKKYDDVIIDLFSTEKHRQAAKDILSRIFEDIRHVLNEEYSPASQKEIVAQGEIMSTNLMHQYMLEEGMNVALLSAFDFMKIDENGEPHFNHIESRLKELLPELSSYDIILTQGFICLNHKGDIDNLQRGGSDYTASIIGAAITADEVDIWTDIDGMHNNDPRFVEETSPVHNLHFEEAAELAYFGAKILHPTCILPAKLNNIPVRLLNTMEPTAEGTLINNELEHGSIKAVAAKDNITAIKIKSSRMLLAYGFLKKVFEVFEKYRTPIDMIATSEVGVSLTIDDDRNLPEIVDELEKLGSVTIDRNMVIICVVGDLEWQNKGFEARALDAIRNIPVRMISYGGSNYNITFLIDKANKTKALRLLSYHLF